MRYMFTAILLLVVLLVTTAYYSIVLRGDPLFPELGQWILESALSDAMRMLEIDPMFVININLSYTQLEKPGFTDRVLETLERIGFPPQNLCLEITERCRLLDMTLLKNIITKFRSRGKGYK